LLREEFDITDPQLAIDFRNAGCMRNGRASTWDVETDSSDIRRFRTLGDVVIKTKVVPDSYYLTEASKAKWLELKNAKKIARVHAQSGVKYIYSEGALPFPDHLNRASRTIL